MAEPHGDPPGDRQANSRALTFFCPNRCVRRFLPSQRLADSRRGGAMATPLEGMAQAGGSTRRAVTLTPQARRLLEGPVLATLLRLAAPTVAMMLLQAVIAA